MMTEKTDRPLGEKVIRAIVSGRCDPWLPEILNAAAQRTKYLRQREAFENLRNIKEGDRVRVVGNIKPRYLAGQEGVVLSVNHTRRRGFPMIEVDMGKIVRNRFGPITSFPASCLRVIPEQGEFEGVTTL